MKRTARKGQGYMPVSFPGFSISNLVRNTMKASGRQGRLSSVYGDVLSAAGNSELNLIPRNGGNFMWSQFYHWKKAGTDLLYIAMFDEVDEATAIFKLAEAEELSTSPEIFITLDRDGYELRNDHYLWMTGVLNFMINGGTEIPRDQPKRLDPQSLIVRRNITTGGEPVGGAVTIEIVLNSIGRAYAEVYRRSQEDKGYLLITRFSMDDSIYTRRVFKDDSALEGIHYSYIVLVYNDSGSVIAASDIAGTGEE